MKGKTKIHIIVIALCLVVISFGYAMDSVHAYSQGNLNANIQYILVTDPAETDGKTVYTPECLDECHLVVKIQYAGTLAPSSISLNPKTKSNLDWSMNKLNLDDDMKIIDVRILKTETYNDTSYSDSCNPFILGNGTVVDNCTTVSSTKEKTRKYFDTVWNGMTLTKGVWYYVDFVGHRTPNIAKKYSTDIIPTIAGYQMTELAWFNSSWINCRNFTISETTNKGVMNKPIEHNFTDMIITTEGAWGLRIVNAPCNVDGTAQPYQVIDNTTDSVRAVFQINLTSGLVANWSYYYNNSGAPNPQYSPVITYRDSFEQGTLNTTYWTKSDNDPGGDALVSGAYGLYGAQSLKITGTGAYYWSVNHAFSPQINGTIELYLRETMGANRGTLYTEFPEYSMIEHNAQQNTVNYTVRDQDATAGAYNNTGIAFVVNTAWAKFVTVGNTTGIWQYIQNRSVLNYTSEARTFDKINIWTEGAGDKYFDEYRLYQNVYDNPSQTYTIEIGSQECYGGCSVTPPAPPGTQTLSVTAYSPGNASYIGNSSIYAQYLINKVNITVDKCWYKLDAGSNTTMSNCANTTIGSLTLGPHTLIIAVNGTNSTNAEFRNQSSIGFTITNTVPSITISSPGNASYVGNSSIFLQFLVSHTGVDTISACWYKVDSTSNVSGCSNTTFSITSLGSHNVTVCARDSWNYEGCSQVNFTVTNTAPSITTSSPSNTTYYYNSSIYNQFTVVHSGVDSIDLCWYKLDSGSNVTSCANTSISVSVGAHLLTRCANDTWGGTGCSSVGFTILPPLQELNVTVQSPSNASYVGNTTINVNYVVKNINMTLDKCWYKFNAGTNTTMSSCSNTTVSITALGDQTLIIAVNGTTWNSTTEFRNETTIRFTITNTVPSVTVSSPSNTTYTGNSSIFLQYNIVHSGADAIDKCWYKIDSEANVSTCNNATLTTALGFHTVTTCVNDTWGAGGCTQINFTTINVVPTPTLNTPANTTYYGNNSVEISYTISHSGVDALDTCWYKYDNTANVTLGGCLNSTLSTGKGWHNLTVCVNDTWGAVGCSQKNFTIISSLTIYAFDEETLSSIPAFNVTITNEVDFSQTCSANASGVAVFNISADGTIKIIVSNTAYETRTYYLAITNNTVLNAYLVLSANAYAQQFLTKDIYDSPLVGAYITIMKWINTSWTTIAMAKSDDSGSASIGLVHGSNYFAVGSVTGYNNKTKSFMPSSDPIIFVFGTERIPDYISWLKGAIEHDCQTDVTARTVNCTINDTMGIVTNTQLVAWRRIGLEWTSFCSPTDSSGPYFLNCTMESANRTYYYTLYATTDDGVYPIEADYMDYRNTLFDYGVMGLLLAFILFLSIPMIARYNPAIAVILSIGIIVLCYWIEFFNVGEMAIVSIVLVGGIIVVLLTRRET